MKNVLNVEQIRFAEQAVIDSGIDVAYLRFGAALAVADYIKNRKSFAAARIAVFCGTGGNGCDGLIAAAMLKRSNIAATVYMVGDIAAAQASAVAYAKSAGVEIMRAQDFAGDAEVIVDAIFGIGLNRNIGGEAYDVIGRLNAIDGAFKLAVDIPSGLNADTGEIMGACFRADVTIAFSCYKTGMLFESGRSVCGEVVVADVGISVSSDVQVLESDDFLIYKRDAAAHKGSVGKVFIIGGCANMIGAPILAGAAAHAAYLNGAGTVTVCLPSVHRAAASARAAMAMMKFLPDSTEGYIKFDKPTLDEIIQKAASIDIGMGMGATPELPEIIEYLCKNFTGGTLVLDADALNAIAGRYEFLSAAKPKIIVTPHVGEFERLTGKSATIQNAAQLARRINGVVVLKSATTIITDGNRIRLNVSGTPAMAKGGTGDVLGGCIAALSCMFDPFDAAMIACYRNGIGAKRAVSAYAEMMLTANDILKYADYKEI